MQLFLSVMETSQVFFQSCISWPSNRKEDSYNSVLERGKKCRYTEKKQLHTGPDKDQFRKSVIH